MSHYKLLLSITLVILMLITFPLVNTYAVFDMGTPATVKHKDMKYHLSGPLWSELTGLQPSISRLDSTDLQAISTQNPSYNLTEFTSPEMNYSFTYNIRVSRDIHYYENEPSITADPSNSSRILVATHQYTERTIHIGVYKSEDAGKTWTGPNLMRLVEPYDSASDPAISASKNSIFYLSYMSIGPRTVKLPYRNVTMFTNDIVVARSSDGSKWSYAIAVNANLTAPSLPPTIYPDMILFDKDYISTNTVGGQDVVVVSFTEFDMGYDLNLSRSVELITIKAVISFDGGVTWTLPIPVSPTYNAMEFERVVQGSSPFVAPDGSIFVAYYDSGEDGWLNGSAYIRVAKYINGTFQEVAYIKTPGEMQYYSGAVGFRWWSSMFPVLKSSGDGEYLYVVFASDPDGRGGDPGDIFFARLHRVGQNKYIVDMPLKRVNDDETKNGQFFPWMDVDPMGNIHIIWGDRRLDPKDFGYDIYYAFSSDDGETFSPNIRVTDITINPLYGMIYFIGDYFNIVATAKNVHVVWTDSRRGIKYMGGFYWIGVDESIFTASLGPRPSPVINVTLDSWQSGETHVMKIRASSLPRESPLAIYIDNILATQMGVPVFTDEEGYLKVSIVTPSSSAGEHAVSIGDILTGVSYGDMKFRLRDISTSVILGNVSKGLDNVYKGLSDMLNSKYLILSSKLDNIASQATEVLSNVKDLPSKLDSIVSKANDISGRLDTVYKEFRGTLNNIFTSSVSAVALIIVDIIIAVVTYIITRKRT